MIFIPVELSSNSLQLSESNSLKLLSLILFVLKY